MTGVSAFFTAYSARGQERVEAMRSWWMVPGARSPGSDTMVDRGVRCPAEQHQRRASRYQRGGRGLRISVRQEVADDGSHLLRLVPPGQVSGSQYRQPPVR